MGVWAFGDVPCNKQKGYLSPPLSSFFPPLKLLDPPLQNVLLLRRFKSIANSLSPSP